VLHPYFKLDYIKHAWGGAEEQAKEQASGNQYAKNWQEEALIVVEKAVSRLWSLFTRATYITRISDGRILDGTPTTSTQLSHTILPERDIPIRI
jgi:hypothetical protein